MTVDTGALRARVAAKNQVAQGRGWCCAQANAKPFNCWSAQLGHSTGSTPESQGTSRPALGKGQSWDDTPLGSFIQCHPWMTSGSFYHGPQQKAAEPLQRSARATLCPQMTTLGPLLFALGCSALLSHPSWVHGASRKSHLGRRNQGSMTLRTTRTTTEDARAPT